MEILVNNNVNFQEIYNTMNNFRLNNAKKIIFETFDKISESKSLNYIGELNKNDVMF